MAAKPSPKPTAAELAILQVLWTRGPSTVREVLEQLHDERKTGYTTTLKFLQIMLDKGLVARDESGHAHIYRAAITKKRTQKQIVGQILDQVFEGSAKQLVMQALASRKSTPDELNEIRQLINELEQKSKGKK